MTVVDESDRWFASVNNLDAINQLIWTRLQDAVSDQTSGWRLPVVATADPTGTTRQRIVVLRSVDLQNRTLFAHTDLRSAKVAAMQTHPVSSWLFYDADQQVQLQATGTARIHTNDDIADRLWDSEADSSLRGYLAPLAPGTRCDEATTNLPPEFHNRVPDRSELVEARQHFAVISCTVNRLEWLALRRKGNLRAVFNYSDDTITADWLAP